MRNCLFRIFGGILYLLRKTTYNTGKSFFKTVLSKIKKYNFNKSRLKE